MTDEIKKSAQARWPNVVDNDGRDSRDIARQQREAIATAHGTIKALRVTILALESERDAAFASLPLIREVTRTEAIKALGQVYRHNVGSGQYPEIGVVEVQQARQVVTSLIADRDWLQGRVKALEQERDTARWDDAERGELLLRIERLTRERDQAMAEATRINQILGEWEDLERETRQERDAAMKRVGEFREYLLSARDEIEALRRLAWEGWQKATDVVDFATFKIERLEQERDEAQAALVDELEALWDVLRSKFGISKTYFETVRKSYHRKMGELK